MEEKPKRIPRPTGTTELSRLYYKERTKHNKVRLTNHILKAFINQDLYEAQTLPTHLKAKAPKPSSKQKKSIKDKDQYIELYVEQVELISHAALCLALGISREKLEAKVTKLLIKESTSVARLQGIQDIEMITRGTILGSFFGIQAKVPEMMSWATELQGVARLKAYQPGFVMGANTAILNAISTQEKVINMAMKISKLVESPRGPSLPTNIQNNIYGTVPGSQNAGTNPDYLTPTSAMRLLEESGLTKVPLDEAYLAKEYGIFEDDIPDVKALITDMQGANNFRIEDIVTVNNHEDRREREEGIADVIMVPNDDLLEE